MAPHPIILGRHGFSLVDLLAVVLILVVLAVIIRPLFKTHPHSNVQPTCMRNQRQITIAVAMYAQDHDEIFPVAKTIWQQIKLSKETLICPEAGKTVPNAYGYNYYLGGLATGDVTNPVATLVTSDCTTTGRKGLPNICYGPKEIAFRHVEKKTKTRMAFASFVDGHVEPIYTANPAWFKPMKEAK